MRTRTQRIVTAAALAFLTRPLPAAWAAKEMEENPALGRSSPFRAEGGMSWDYVGKADTGFRDSRQDVSRWLSGVQAAFFPAFKRNLHWRLGASWQRLTFDAPAAEPLPGKLQSANAIVGFDHRLNRRWDMRLEARPGLYGDFSDVYGGTFNIPVIAGFSYFWSPRLLILGGFMVNARGDLPFFPFVGARWQIDERWRLDFVAPKPRLLFEAARNLSVYSGLEIHGGTYRVARDFGSKAGDPRLDGDLLSVREYRAGGGVEWKITPTLLLDGSGGWMLERRLHYHEADVNLYSKGAPYASLSLRWRWAR